VNDIACQMFNEELSQYPNEIDEFTSARSVALLRWYDKLGSLSTRPAT
jgi:hypothetical protein